MLADRKILPHRSSTGQSVYLLDSHELARRGLRQLVEADGIRISGESGSAREAVRQIPALRPDLVIVDDDLTDGSGAGVSSAIAEAAPSIRCLLITGDADETVLIDSILAGAWGCLSKQDDSSEQLRLIRRALRGHRAYSHLFQPALMDRDPGPSLPDETPGLLTKQEMNVAIGVARGLSNRQISQEMSLTEHTLNILVSSVLTKLDVADTAVSVALLNCTSEGNTLPPTDTMRACDAARLADALAATRAGCFGSCPPGGRPSNGGRQFR